MLRASSKIGFDDRLVTVILVPGISLIIPFVFMGMRIDQPPYFTWKAYLSVVIITSVIWLGNRYIMIWARTRYSQFEMVKKRLLIQSLVMLVYTLLLNNILGYVLDVCGLKEHQYTPGHDLYTIIV